MKKKVLFKNIAFTLAFSTVMLIGGNVAHVYAAEPITKDIDMAQMTDIDMIQTININNFKESTEKVSRTITITDLNIIFHKNKAFNEGFTNKEVKTLNSLYTEMNEMIKNNEVSIVKTSTGNYDIKLNDITKLMEHNDNLVKTRSVITKRWYEYDFYFSARQCGAAVAGVLGLTGHVPEAIATTVAAGVMGLGSSYLWYCSNCNGLDASYNYVTGVSFKRNNNC
ncbi:hypothetical protein [Haloimpatiens massiliensis]|uniref:hypothetical protein n=1 Tax=Haloimpatiens massiliensis TaxID=1658110 RepID=UPI000C85D4B2|nr:hypothetical protein [Haloimpatiens massiliensis]